MVKKNQKNSSFKDKFQGVNPSISDSSTYAFATAQDMIDTFNGENDQFLYSRHSSPSNAQLADEMLKWKELKLRMFLHPVWARFQLL